MMATLQDKFNKIDIARAKTEIELDNIYGKIKNAVDKQGRKVHTERVIVKCEEAFTRVVDKNEELSGLAQKKLNIQLLPVRTLKNGQRLLLRKLTSSSLLLEGTSIRSKTKRQQSSIPFIIQDHVHI